MIETRNLTKTFDDFTAVDSLNLTIETGEFFGLLGPNGSRKNNDDQSFIHPAPFPQKGRSCARARH